MRYILTLACVKYDKHTRSPAVNSVHTTADVGEMTCMFRSGEQCTVVTQVLHEQLQKFTAGSTMINGPLRITNVVCEFNTYGTAGIKVLPFDPTFGAVPYV